MRMLPLLLALPLAACGGGTAPTDNGAAVANAAASGGEGDYRAAVSRLEPAARNGVFIRAILDAGYTCQGVTGATEQPGSPGLWTATCDDGARYGVQIAANGTATVSGAVQR